MFKFHILFLAALFISLFVNIKSTVSSIDLSDDNPIVYCLKTARHFTFEEVKDYLLRTQVPEYSSDEGLDDPLFSWCVEQASRDD